MVVDETNTGCGATGKGFFAYDGTFADYMTFGKRTQATGFYHKNGHGIELGGKEHDVAMLEVIKKEIDNDNLIKRVA